MTRVATTVIALVVVTRTAAAEPALKPARVCKPAGPVLFEIAQRVENSVTMPTATTRLFDNGAWTTDVTDPGHKPERTRAGCLERSDLDHLREGLRAVAWKTTPTGRTCPRDQPAFTTYTWGSRLLYTERTCNVDALDRDSHLVINLAGLLLGAPVSLVDDRAFEQ